MKKILSNQSRRQEAFTLIELLVVMAIIALLAALIIPLAGSATASAQKARVSTELTKIETAISAYKDKVGFYPPDNPIGPDTNQLYYELTGTIYNPNAKNFTNADGTIIGPSTISTWFGVDGFANATQNPEEKPPFRFPFEPNDYSLVQSNPPVELLVCPVQGPHMITATGGKLLNPWRYNSSHPTNNPNSYDLWVDVTIRGKTNRFCNWSTEPIILQ
ncbi:MAG TPA: prepilin-type N-terminal cleavage/methylation domain-containing protein [Verrucomicrobiae bacterium]|nr:prepilin-type N-terminal cleavage/methylation domain-containing protein [Verrucomicrobiae bacterium]